MVSFENEEAELDNVKSLLSMNVDGIIIDSVATSQKHKVHNLLNKHNKPFIYLDRKPVSLKNAVGVFFDDENLNNPSGKIVKTFFPRIIKKAN